VLGGRVPDNGLALGGSRAENLKTSGSSEPHTKVRPSDPRNFTVPREARHLGAVALRAWRWHVHDRLGQAALEVPEVDLQGSDNTSRRCGTNAGEKQTSPSAPAEARVVVSFRLKARPMTGPLCFWRVASSGSSLGVSILRSHTNTHMAQLCAHNTPSKWEWANKQTSLWATKGKRNHRPYRQQ